MKHMKPTTSGQRGVTYENRSDITSQKPVKSLLKPIKRNGGRDSSGRISVRHRGGGAKRKYRVIEFNSPVEPLKANVLTIEYDPNRNARIALIKYETGKIAYILAPHKLVVGSSLQFGEDVKPLLGSRLKLKNIPTGVDIHAIELYPGSRAKLVRSAGSSATILAKDDDYANVKLPSGEVRKIHFNCYASIGQLSNIEHSAVTVGKAGRKRWMGKRPTVRGKAMNPDAHPHGGGEARNSIGLKYPKTPWGKHALGVKTRAGKKPTNAFIVKRRK